MRPVLVYAVVAGVLWFPAVVAIFSGVLVVARLALPQDTAGAVAAVVALALSTAVAVPVAGLLRRQLAP